MRYWPLANTVPRVRYHCCRNAPEIIAALLLWSCDGWTHVRRFIQLMGSTYYAIFEGTTAVWQESWRMQLRIIYTSFLIVVMIAYDAFYWTIVIADANRYLQTTNRTVMFYLHDSLHWMATADRKIHYCDSRVKFASFFFGYLLLP